jgi:hypothetical protein
MRWRAVVPALAFAVERPADVVTIPVGNDRERHDWNAESFAVRRNQHRLTVVLVLDEVAGDPAALVVEDDVAPFPAVRATPMRMGAPAGIMSTAG